jgi:hypothetical protein
VERHVFQRFLLAWPTTDFVVGVTAHPTEESKIKSRKHAAGNRLPAISSVTGMGLMVRYSSADFDQWAFAIDRHRGALHSKTLIVIVIKARIVWRAHSTSLCRLRA